MAFKHFFIPEIIKIPDSKYVHNISIIRYALGDTLLADGLIESGNIMTHIWKVGIKNLLPKTYKPKKVLLLGLAGGSNAGLINKLYKDAEITAVEIDPVMIEIGFKYFNLGKVRNLEIVTGDALDFANTLSDKDFYDLVLVDCFFGQEIPRKLESLEFFQKLKDHSTYTLVNRLWHLQFKQISQNFINNLATRFQFVSTFTGTNLVISLI